MAAPAQSRKKSQPPKFLSSFGIGSIPAIDPVLLGEKQIENSNQ
jgi:hypothetical protein